MLLLVLARWSAISFRARLRHRDEPMNVERLAQELAAHLVLTRPLVCVDLEATGVWPGQDRIVQIATASIFPDGSLSTWSSLVNPEQPMPPAALAIHGITDAMVGGPRRMVGHRSPKVLIIRVPGLTAVAHISSWKSSTAPSSFAS